MNVCLCMYVHDTVCVCVFVYMHVNTLGVYVIFDQGGTVYDARHI